MCLLLHVLLYEPTSFLTSKNRAFVYTSSEYSTYNVQYMYDPQHCLNVGWLDANVFDIMPCDILFSFTHYFFTLAQSVVIV